MSETANQQEVVERYREYSGVEDVGTVGDYVRIVKTESSGAKTCFGPLDDRKQLNWKVVEIDWERLEFLLAPIGE